MHRLAASLSQTGARGAARSFASAARYAVSSTAAGRTAGVDLSSGERIEADAVVLTADVAALALGLFGDDAARAGRTHARSRTLTVRDDLELRGHKRAGSRCCVTTSSSRATIAPSSRACSAIALMPHEPTVYVCAQDRDDRSTDRVAAERLFVLVNAPAIGDRHRFELAEISQCARRTFALLERCGLTIHIDVEADSSARRRRTSTGCFRGRAARCTAAARTAGWRRSSGRGREPSCRGFIWRAAARTRDRACRWRRCRAGWRQRA